MVRGGKVFALGNPYISEKGGIIFSLPKIGENDNFQIWLEKNKEDLRDILLEKIKVCFDSLGNRGRGYPYSPESMEGLNFQITNNCGCVTIKRDLGGFVNTHNLDGFAERCCAFNIGAEVLEAYDPTILAPHIVVEGDNPLIKYPLPEGIRKIPTDNEKLKYFFHEGGLQRILEVGKAGQLESIEEGEDEQRFVLDKGEFVVREGMIEGRGFSKFGICRATFPLAKIVDSCGFI